MAEFKRYKKVEAKKEVPKEPEPTIETTSSTTVDWKALGYPSERAYLKFN